jgi:excinuclease ABC subunit B
VVSDYTPTGDQPEAISRLAKGLEEGRRRLVLEGVTGSGKTFTAANIIAAYGRPTLVISHNKTLAAQLYSELKAFLPHNAVGYFISYYDYYQPEAYIPQTDTYIEKDAAINEEIERRRLEATNMLLGRRDVVIVASVSCIYGLGSPEDYRDMLVELREGSTFERDDLLARLVSIQYERNDYAPSPGNFRVRGDIVDIFPSYSEQGLRIEFFGDEIDAVRELDPVTGRAGESIGHAFVSPAKHFVMPREKMRPAVDRIRDELRECVARFEQDGRLLEAQRLQQRTEFDLEMLRELGYCNGIENYSRHLSGRGEGQPPACLLDYFPDDFLTIVDESHVTLPQIRGMFNGDQARKRTLVEHGFRLPSALDNRPLSFHEFIRRIGPMLCLSATPGAYERAEADCVAEQVVRPTGLLDPPVEMRPLQNQIDDLIEEVRRTAEQGDRTLVTTLTKRTAEDLSGYLRETGLRVEYLHSDIDALERVRILARLREGKFDCLVGINLLREGLDLPEVALVAVLDADKEGFLRSGTSLIQTAGRAARHERGRVILYADVRTAAIDDLIRTTESRRARQRRYNEEHGIVPHGVTKPAASSLGHFAPGGEDEASAIARRAVAESPAEYDVRLVEEQLEQEMMEAAAALEFERAAALRDELRELRSLLAEPASGGAPPPKSRKRPARSSKGKPRKPGKARGK